MNDLSRLLDGELPPEEAAALRARIAADPALARRWEQMGALPASLAALPREDTGPQTRIPAAPAPARTTGHGRRLVAVAGWLAAAVALVALLWPGPTRVLVRGTERVDGRATIAAGPLSVTVDGVADVTVEPAVGAIRGSGVEAVPMATSHLLAGLGGALVTVSVLEGAAWIRGETGPVVEVVAGESRTVGGPAPGGSAGGRRSTDGGAPAGDAATIAALTDELEKVKLERALALGQLRRLEGTPQPWPADVPVPYRPEEFRRLLDARLATIPHAEVVVVDCDEYPCVALLRSTSTSPEWVKELAPVHDDLGSAGFGDDVSVMGAAAETQEDEGAPTRLYAFGVAAGARDSEVAQRMGVRLQDMLKDTTQEVIEEERHE